MSVQIIDNAKVWLAGYDISGDVNAFAMDASVDLKEFTTLGNNSIRRLPGLKQGGFSVEGYWNDGAVDSNTDDYSFSQVGNDGILLSMAPETGADGEIAYFINAVMAEYSAFAALGEVHPFSCSGELSDADVIRGNVMHNNTRTASGNGVTRQLGAISATQQLYAGLHVISGSGTLDVTIESDDNSGMSSAVTRGTFTQKTGQGFQWLTPVAGAITDDWWRVAWTIAGGSPSFNFVVVIGIQ